jgi:hypothetical protein
VGHLYGIHLPTTAHELEQWLGHPDRIDLSADVPNPDGQWFRWGIGRSSDTFSAMNDQYDGKANLRSRVWFVELRANRRGVARRTLLGFVFNRTTKARVKRTFGGRLVACRGRFGPWNLKYYHKGLWTYFIFSSRARLVGIAQGTSDLDSSG